MGFKKGLLACQPILLEPIVNISIEIPEEYMGDVIGDLNSRRAKISEMGSRGNVRFIKGTVPLSEMFGYATDLRSRTQGRASYTMHFLRYEQAPASVAEGVIAKIQGKAVEK